jgi:hypothetical protein
VQAWSLSTSQLQHVSNSSAQEEFPAWHSKLQLCIACSPSSGTGPTTRFGPASASLAQAAGGVAQQLVSSPGLCNKAYGWPAQGECRFCYSSDAPDLSYAYKFFDNLFRLYFRCVIKLS